jgi:serine/threonine-protein kinase
MSRRDPDRAGGLAEGLETGDRLGRYEVIALIGEGGMGEVWRARDSGLEREVAIKILPAELGEDPGRRQRFQQEARAASACNHPNLLAVHDVGRQGSIDYLVTELLRGESLRKRVQRGRLPLREALDLTIQAARGLSAAHERGIVHRDLKPENLFVTDEGVLKILDFGIARQVHDKSLSRSELDQAETREALTATGSVLGTIGYMAPEQIAGSAVDARADLFALGCVFYELLTGSRAFAGDTPAAVLGAALVAEPPSLRDCGVAAPAAVEEILRRCLAKKREDRIGSARELAAALEEARGTLTTAIEATTVARPRGRERRVGGRVVAAATVAIAALVLIAIGISQRRDGAAVAPRSAATPATIDSLAVLPLDNLAGSPEQDYFADAMTEALIGELSRIRALKVISRTSAMRFKGTDRPLPAIARELGVRGVIEGAVARDGERVRIDVRLLDAPADTLVWAEHYTRPARDLLELQAEVARAIAREVRVVITPGEQSRFDESRPVNPQAHRYALQAQQRLATSDYQRDAVAEAAELSRKALEVDPDFALGHAILGTALWTSGGAGHRPMLDACLDARRAAEKAFELEPGLPEARLLVTRVQMSCDFDWSGAEKNLVELLEIVPGDASVHDTYAWLLSNVGRHDEALEQAQLAEELDPLNEQILVQQAQYLFRARRFAEAEAHLQGVLADFPESVFAQWCLGTVKVAGNDPERGLEILLARKAPNADMNFVVGYAHGRAGRRQEAEKVLEFLLARRDREYVPATMIAIVYAGLGDRDRAIAWLETAVGERSLLIDELAVNPLYDPLRDDPRFGLLLERTGLRGVAVVRSP